jgi:succinyl-diaminopimelate desuccinylase
MLSAMDAPDLSFDAALRFAQDLIRIQGLPGREGETAARVMRELIALGFRDVRSDAVGNVLAVAPGRGGTAPVMVCSHMDVVDVGDATAWEYPPYGGVIEGGYLHGRGAMDIKGPLALQTYAAAQFLREPAAGDVVVAHTVLEERGGWGMAHLMATGEVRPGAIIIGEATAGDICIGHRGRAELLIEVRGTAGHASAPERAKNPVSALPAVVAALDSFGGTLGGDPILGPSTAAVTAIETLPSSRNVIPDTVRLVLDWRVLPGVLPDAAVERLAAHMQQHVTLPPGIALEVRIGTEAQRTWTGLVEERRLFTPGFLLDPEHPVAVGARRCVAAATGREPALRPWTFATDGGHSCGVHGIPTIGYAPGEERYAHTNRERLELRSAEEAYALYPELLRAVLGIVAG